MIEFRHLETFRVVAFTLNFTKAAAILGYSQSSITTHIKALEKSFGARLLNRGKFSGPVTLTEAGQCALEYTQRLFATAEEAIVAAQCRAGSD